MTDPDRCPLVGPPAMNPAPPPEATPADDHAAVVFIDLSGFTALTEVHGDFEAADTAEAFADLTRAALGDHDHLVKTIGDAVLLTTPTAEAALRLARRITETTHAASGFPVLRIGTAYGPIVNRRNDIYGTTVNTAARIAAEAGPGQTLATGPVAAAARSAGLSVTDLGPMTLRNLAQPIPVLAVDLGIGCHCDHVDPVCRMHLRDGDTATSLTYRGITYYFCSTHCAHHFSTDPTRFTDATRCPDNPGHHRQAPRNHEVTP